MEVGPAFRLEDVKDSVERKAVEIILTDLNRAHNSIAKAARKWITLSEETRDQVIEGTPQSMRDIWRKLDRVGAGTLHPRLVTSSGLASRYLGKLPIEEQEKHLTELVEVAITKNGRADVLRVDVENMSSLQRQQVFAVTGNSVKIRSIPEQKAWLAAREQKEREKEIHTATTRIERPGRWTVEKGKVFVDPTKMDTGLTKRDILSMLKDLGL